MRRFGGIVLSASLLMAGCASAGSADATRSTMPSPSPVAVPDAELAEAAAPTAPETSADVDTSTDTTPATTDGEADADTPPSSTPQEPSGGTLDPVPASSRSSVRTVSATAPSGPRPTGRIEIPTIGLSHATYDGVELSTLNHGPGHWPGTARPGHAGNAVFPGHRTTYSRPFWDIDRLAPGHHVIFTTSEGRFTYRVTDTFVIDDEETWIVRQTADPTFTIFGCHPKGSARQRYVVKGDLVSTPATTTTTTTTTSPPSTTTTTEPDRGLLGLFG